VHYGSLLWVLRSCWIVKVRCPHFQSLNHMDCSIKFGTNFDHVTADTLQKFKVKVSKVTVTTWRNIIAGKRYKLWTDRLTEFKVGKIITVQSATWHMFKVITSNELEIEIWQIIDLYLLYSEKNTWKRRRITESLLSLRNRVAEWMAMPEFQPELRNITTS